MHYNCTRETHKIAKPPFTKPPFCELPIQYDIMNNKPLLIVSRIMIRIMLITITIAILSVIVVALNNVV